MFKLKNPVLIASGIAGFGEEYSKIFDLNLLGGFITKTITLKPKIGNKPPRILEIENGLMNSIGLENPGLEIFIKEKLLWLNKNIKIPLIVSIAGDTIDEFVKIAKILDKQKGIFGLELNLSCPNIKYKTKCFAQDKEMLYKIVKKVKENTKLFVIPKLTGIVDDITETSILAEKAGADAISLINTIPSLVFLKNNSMFTGGLSGKCIKPIVLKVIQQVNKNIKIPVIGCGGINDFNDVIDFLKTGAKYVAIGSGLFKNPLLVKEIIMKFNILKKSFLNYEKNSSGT